MDDQSAAGEKRASRLRGDALDHERLASHYAWVRSVAHNLVRDPWGAEDVTQETLLAALKAPPPDVPDEQRLRAWLGRVAFNLSRLGARQGARRRAREQRVARNETTPSVCEQLVASGTLDALSAAIAGLDEPYRGVVVMRYFDELSTAEIAERTNTSELAVRKRLWRARNKLRDSIEHDPKSGRILAALLSLKLGSNAWRELGLAGLAASVAVCAGVAWWSGDVPPPTEAAVLESAGLGARSPLPVGRKDETRPAQALPARAPGNAREPEPGPPREEPPAKDGPSRDTELRVASIEGSVIDLGNTPRGGIELFDIGAPDEVLATSGPGGGFRIPRRSVEPSTALVVAGRAAGWTTVVPARLDPGARSVSTPVLLAPAAELQARVLDEQGRGIPEARFELSCEEFAFRHLTCAVHLESALFASFACDAEGTCHEPALPRAEGLLLTLRAPGFEPLERATLELRNEEVFVLRRAPREEFLTGIVLRSNGQPAVGAEVKLAQGSTTTDGSGRFRLPVRGVTEHSCLEASDGDKAADPARVPDFGARLQTALGGDLELVLGEENDTVDGKLVGDGSRGWLVAAYVAGGGPLDERGIEAPAALTRSADDGAFQLSLRRGLYDLYALAPGAPRVAHRAALGTRWGHWSMDLPTGAFRTSEGTLVDDEGEPLQGAEIEVHVRLDGAEGHRRLGAQLLASDRGGAFQVEHAPELGLELEVSHASLGRQACLLAVGSLAEEGPVPPLRLERPALLRVAGAPAERCAFLDVEGEALLVQAPLHATRAFALHEGASPVLEVPAAARWLRLENGGEPWTVPVEPRSGQLLDIRP